MRVDETKAGGATDYVDQIRVRGQEGQGLTGALAAIRAKHEQGVQDQGATNQAPNETDTGMPSGNPSFVDQLASAGVQPVRSR